MTTRNLHKNGPWASNGQGEAPTHPGGERAKLFGLQTPNRIHQQITRGKHS